MTKFAAHLPLKFITSAKLTFGERVELHRVERHVSDEERGTERARGREREREREGERARERERERERGRREVGARLWRVNRFQANVILFTCGVASTTPYNPTCKQGHLAFLSGWGALMEGPRKALRGGISKVNFHQVCQLLTQFPTKWLHERGRAGLG